MNSALPTTTVFETLQTQCRDYWGRHKHTTTCALCKHAMCRSIYTWSTRDNRAHCQHCHDCRENGRENMEPIDGQTCPAIVADILQNGAIRI